MNPNKPKITRAEFINNIIKQRQPFAEEIALIEKHLRDVDSEVIALENYRQQLQASVNDIQIKAKLEQFRFSQLIQNLKQTRVQLHFLKARFSRSTLNIGVIGETGAGKSTLFKSLSGLTDNEIPAFEGGACTAVRSIIENRECETKAAVTKHSKETFLKEVICPYYQQLDLGEPPASLEDFANKTFPSEPPSSIKSAKKEKMYNHLKDDYYHTLNFYQKELQSGNPQTFEIKKEEIPDYVIQKRDVNGRLTTFKHLIVKEVKIFCYFQDEETNNDIGSIALVDVPGMGDTRLGDEQIMLETLGREVDVVLFVHRPDSLRYLWKDYSLELYDNASKALNNFEKRTFIILNHNKNNDNLKACEQLKQTLNHIKVVRCEIADCNNSKNTHRIFNFVLNHLTNNINELDKQFAHSLKTPIIQTLNEVKTELEKAKGILLNYTNEYVKFKQLFQGKTGIEGLWGEMTHSLGKLLDELKEKRDSEDANFKEKVTQTIQKCKENKYIPSAERIEKEQYAMGGRPEIYFHYLKVIRTHLSRQFLTLDINLQNSLENAKRQVTKILSEQGNLEKISSLEGSDFLKEITVLLPENSESNLYLGFKNISEFNVSLAGIILRYIRKHLEPLFSNDHKLTEYSSAEAIHKNFDDIYMMVLDNCEKSLNELYPLPNQIAYAMVEEFIDRIFYAEGVKDEWEYFLREKRYHIFEELKEFAEREENKIKWERLIKEAEEKNNLAIQIVTQTL